VSKSVADVCIVGVGAVGGILAKELSSAGLTVVGFERGPAPKLIDYAPRDSIRFIARADQLDWVRHEPTTTRKNQAKARACITAQAL
jgi:gluconate 2-dehydrogenase alpha chain